MFFRVFRLSALSLQCSATGKADRCINGTNVWQINIDSKYPIRIQPNKLNAINSNTSEAAIMKKTQGNEIKEVKLWNF